MTHPLYAIQYESVRYISKSRKLIRRLENVWPENIFDYYKQQVAVKTLTATMEAEKRKLFV